VPSHRDANHRISILMTCCSCCGSYRILIVDALILSSIPSESFVSVRACRPFLFRGCTCRLSLFQFLVYYLFRLLYWEIIYSGSFIIGGFTPDLFKFHLVEYSYEIVDVIIG